jgi:hypothetical protein
MRRLSRGKDEIVVQVLPVVVNEVLADLQVLLYGAHKAAETHSG